MTDNEYFKDLKRNYYSEHIYYIYKPKNQGQQPKEKQQHNPPNNNYIPNGSPSPKKEEQKLYPSLAFTDTGPEFVNPKLENYNFSPNLSPSTNGRKSHSNEHKEPKFSNGIYAPLAKANISFVKDPNELLPDSLKSLNIGELTVIIIFIL